MQFAAAMFNVLALAAALPAASRIALLPPRSRAAFELTVQQWGSPHVEQVRRAGSHELDLRCSHVQGMTAALVVEVEEHVEPPAGETRWHDCGPEDVGHMAQAGDPVAVRFPDTFAGAQRLPAGAVLPGGGRASCAFRTAGGVLCLVPEGRPELRALATSALPGDEMVICGRPLSLPGGLPALLVERLGRPSEAPEPDAVRWEVTARWAGREAARFSVPGDYPLKLPCAFREGAFEQVLLRLTEVKRVDLTVKGHAVDAELADTAEKRSWGLQGRSGLGEDEGMLFFFERAERPFFVMKTVSFPLSIAFIRADGTIVHIARLNPGDPRRAGPPVPVNYVLEMRQGWFAEHGVAPGDVAVIP